MSACRDAFMIHLSSRSMTDISFPAWSSKVHLRTRTQVRARIHENYRIALSIWGWEAPLMGSQTLPVLNIRTIRALFDVTMLRRSSYTSISRSQNERKPKQLKLFSWMYRNWKNWSRVCGIQQTTLRRFLWAFTDERSIGKVQTYDMRKSFLHINSENADNFLRLQRFWVSLL